MTGVRRVLFRSWSTYVDKRQHNNPSPKNTEKNRNKVQQSFFFWRKNDSFLEDTRQISKGGDPKNTQHSRDQNGTWQNAQLRMVPDSIERGIHFSCFWGRYHRGLQEHRPIENPCRPNTRTTKPNTVQVEGKKIQTHSSTRAREYLCREQNRRYSRRETKNKKYYRENSQRRPHLRGVHRIRIR